MDHINFVSIFIFYIVNNYSDMSMQHPQVLKVYKDQEERAEEVAKLLQLPQMAKCFQRQAIALQTISNSVSKYNPETRQEIDSFNNKFQKLVEKTRENFQSPQQTNQFEKIHQKLQTIQTEQEKKLEQLKNIYEGNEKTIKKTYQEDLTAKNQQIQSEKWKTKQKDQKLLQMQNQWKMQKEQLLLKITEKQTKFLQQQARANRVTKQKQAQVENRKKLEIELQKKKGQLKTAKSEIQRLCSVCKNLEAENNSKQSFLEKIYKITPEGQLSKKGKINEKDMFGGIQNAIDQYNKIRNILSKIDGLYSNNLIDTSSQLLDFWKKYYKPIEKTKEALKKIKDSQFSSQQIRKMNSSKSEYLENFSEVITRMNTKIEQGKNNQAKLKEDIDKKTKQFIKLKGQKQTLSLQSKAFQVQAVQNDKNKEKIISDLNAKLQKVNNQKRILEVNVVNLNNDIINLNIDITNLQAQIKNWEKKFNDLTTKTKIQISDLKSKLKQEEEKKQNWQNTYKGEKKTHDELKQKYAKEVKDHQTTSSNLQDMTNKYQNKKRQNQQLDNKIKQKEDQIRRLNNDIDTKDKENKRLNNQINQRKNQIIKLNENIDKLTTTIKNLQYEINILKKQISQLTDKLKITEQQLKNTIQKLKQSCQTFNNIIMETCGIDIQLSIDNLQAGKQKIYQAIISKSFVTGSQAMEKLSTNNIALLVKNMEKRRNRKVKGLKLVYKKDSINQINFHNYIDNREDIFMIIRLVNQYVIGGYTRQPINKLVTPGVGFIFSFSKNKQIILEINQDKSNARVVTPQEYQIIFGNSQIKLNQMSPNIFSNVGILAQHFNATSQKITVCDFLGTQIKPQSNQHKEVQMSTYEFYQVEWN